MTPEDELKSRVKSLIMADLKGGSVTPEVYPKTKEEAMARIQQDIKKARKRPAPDAANYWTVNITKRPGEDIPDPVKKDPWDYDLTEENLNREFQSVQETGHIPLRLMSPENRQRELLKSKVLNMIQDDIVKQMPPDIQKKFEVPLTTEMPTLAQEQRLKGANRTKSGATYDIDNPALGTFTGLNRGPLPAITRLQERERRGEKLTAGERTALAAFYGVRGFSDTVTGGIRKSKASPDSIAEYTPQHVEGVITNTVGTLLGLSKGIPGAAGQGYKALVEAKLIPKILQSNKLSPLMKQVLVRGTYGAGLGPTLAGAEVFQPEKVPENLLHGALLGEVFATSSGLFPKKAILAELLRNVSNRVLGAGAGQYSPEFYKSTAEYIKTGKADPEWLNHALDEALMFFFSHKGTSAKDIEEILPRLKAYKEAEAKAGVNADAMLQAVSDKYKAGMAEVDELANIKVNPDIVKFGQLVVELENAKRVGGTTGYVAKKQRQASELYQKIKANMREGEAMPEELGAMDKYGNRVPGLIPKPAPKPIPIPAAEQAPAPTPTAAPAPEQKKKAAAPTAPEPIKDLHTDEHYVYSGGQYVKTEGKDVNIVEGRDTFLHKTGKNWSVVEGKSGTPIGFGASQEEAIAMAKSALTDKNFDTTLNQRVANAGLSPRYVQAEGAGMLNFQQKVVPENLPPEVELIEQKLLMKGKISGSGTLTDPHRSESSTMGWGLEMPLVELASSAQRPKGVGRPVENAGRGERGVVIERPYGRLIRYASNWYMQFDPGFDPQSLIKTAPVAEAKPPDLFITQTGQEKPAPPVAPAPAATPEVAKPKTTRVTLPSEFWDDHSERTVDRGPGHVTEVSRDKRKKLVTLDLSDEELADLKSDADLYGTATTTSERGGSTGMDITRSLRDSAKRTREILRGQATPEAAKPEPAKPEPEKPAPAELTDAEKQDANEKRKFWRTTRKAQLEEEVKKKGQRFFDAEEKERYFKLVAKYREQGRDMAMAKELALGEIINNRLTNEWNSYAYGHGEPPGLRDSETLRKLGKQSEPPKAQEPAETIGKPGKKYFSVIRWEDSKGEKHVEEASSSGTYEEAMKAFDDSVTNAKAGGFDVKEDTYITGEIVEDPGNTVQELSSRKTIAELRGKKPVTPEPKPDPDYVPSDALKEYQKQTALRKGFEKQLQEHLAKMRKSDIHTPKQKQTRHQLEYLVERAKAHELVAKNAFMARGTAEAKLPKTIEEQVEEQLKGVKGNKQNPLTARKRRNLARELGDEIRRQQDSVDKELFKLEMGFPVEMATPEQIMEFKRKLLDAQEDMGIRVPKKARLGVSKAASEADDVELFAGKVRSAVKKDKGGPGLIVKSLKDTLVEAEMAKEPWEMTKGEFESSPPSGYIYKPGRGYAAQRANGVTNVSDSFFELDAASRKSLLNHEVGHDLVRDFNGNFKDVFEPLKKGRGKDSYGQNREIYDNPFGFRENPEEIIADTYASLFEPFPYERGGKYDALRHRVAEVALREGKPVPPEVLREYPDLARAMEAAGVKHKVTLYRGAEKEGPWYTTDSSAAKEYAGLWEKGQITKKEASLRKVAEPKDLYQIAEELGLKDAKEQAAYHLVTPEVYRGADAILKELEKRGYDAVRLPHGEDFAPSGRAIESYRLIDVDKRRAELQSKWDIEDEIASKVKASAKLPAKGPGLSIISMKDMLVEAEMRGLREDKAMLGYLRDKSKKEAPPPIDGAPPAEAKVAEEKKWARIPGLKVVSNLRRMGSGGNKAADAIMNYARKRMQWTQRDLYDVVNVAHIVENYTEYAGKERPGYLNLKARRADYAGRAEATGRRIREIIEGKIKPTDEIEARAVQIVKERLDELGNLGESLGLKIHNVFGEKKFKMLERFYPHEWLGLQELWDGEISRNFKDAIIEKIAKERDPDLYNDPVTKDQAIDKAKRYWEDVRSDLKTARYGHLEMQRILTDEFVEILRSRWEAKFPDKPFPLRLNDDIGVLYRYLAGANDRIAWLQEFGKDEADGKGGMSPEKVLEWAGEMENPENRAWMKERFRDYLRKSSSGKWRNVSHFIQTYQLSKMTFAAIPNMGQWFINTVPNISSKAALEAMIDTAKYYGLGGSAAKQEARKFFSQTGAGRLSAAMQQAMSKDPSKYADLADIVLKAYGFTGTEFYNRLYSSFAGKRYAEHLAGKLQKSGGQGWRSPQYIRELKKLGFAEADIEKLIKDGPMTEVDAEKLAQASYEMTRLTQFMTDTFFLPASWADPRVRVLTQFKNFSYNQTSLLYNGPLKEATLFTKSLAQKIARGGKGEVIGDITPMIKTAALLPIGGAFVYHFKKELYKFFGLTFYDKMLAGKSDGLKFFSYIFNAGGFGIGSDIVASVAMGKTGMVNLIGGPTSSDIFEFLDAFNKSMQEIKVAVDNKNSKWLSHRSETIAQYWARFGGKLSPTAKVIMGWFSNEYQKVNDFNQWSRLIRDVYRRYKETYMLRGPAVAEEVWQGFMNTQGKEYEEAMSSIGQPRKLQKPTKREIQAWWKEIGSEPSERVPMSGKKTKKGATMGQFYY